MQNTGNQHHDCDGNDGVHRPLDGLFFQPDEPVFKGAGKQKINQTDDDRNRNKREPKLCKEDAV